MRNVWAYSIIFCGHFPDQTYTFSEEEVADETRGGFYVRQLLGAANIDGGPLFHLLAGNLSFQVEHHLYPDMPSSRYAEIAPRVRDICRRYGLPYNTGPLHRQLGTVHRTILRLAFPGGRVRPKPGAYRPTASSERPRRAGVSASPSGAIARRRSSRREPARPARGPRARRRASRSCGGLCIRARVESARNSMCPLPLVIPSRREAVFVVSPSAVYSTRCSEPMLPAITLPLLMPTPIAKLCS